MRVRCFVLLVIGLLLALSVSFWPFGQNPGETDEIRSRMAEKASGVLGDASSAGRPDAAATRSPSDSAGPPQGASRLQLGLASLEQAALSRDRARLLEAARALRELLIEKPDLISEAAAALGDENNGMALRQVLGVVLGSLPGSEGKAAVLRVLKSGTGEGFQRSLLLALNIVPEASPPLFRRDGHPHALEAAPGLTVFVRGAVDDLEARQMLEGFLKSPDRELRLVAARVLRDSVTFSSTRHAMRERLSDREQDEEVRAEAAAALAHWSKRQDPSLEERSPVVDQLLRAMGDSEELVRFRLLSPMAQMPLQEGELTRLRSMAKGDPEEEVRRSAAEIVGRRMQHVDEEQAKTAPLLADLLVKDPAASVRETSALWLGHAEGSPAAAKALRQAAILDEDPEVRAAAITALASFRALPEARATIVRARENDPDPLVQASAKRALGEPGAGRE